MAEQLAFLSLARRVGNPMADRPEAIAAVEAFELVQAFRTLPRSQQKVVRATIDALAWLRKPRIPALN